MDAGQRALADDRSLDSPLDRARDSMLPGMAIEVMPLPISDEEMDDLPVHTAERLLELHPDRYALATALFFGCPTMSGREICRIARVGSHTMQCIIDREERGRTADEWRKGASARLRSIADLSMSAAQHLLADHEAVRDAGIKGVATLLRESTHAHELLAGRMPGQFSKPVSDADEYLAGLVSAQGQSIEAEILEGSRGDGESGSAVDGEQEPTQ